MHLNLPKGKKAEELAVQFLIKEGYQILSQNYRSGHSEIDIICTKDNVLIFVEVKFRSSLFFGYPEEAVTDSKIKSIHKASENYIFENLWQKDIRFDVISITSDQIPHSIYHIIDAF